MTIREWRQFIGIRNPWSRVDPAAVANPLPTIRSGLSPEQIVAVGTLALALAAIGFVLRFASNLPNTDEWDLLGMLVGERWPIADYLSPHNEHRYPLGRFLWATIVRVTDDFRAGMLLTVVLLTIASRALALTAARVRGYASVGDLLIPALLLNWGHAFNLMMAYQIVFGLYTLALAGFAWAAVRNRPHLAGLSALIAVQSGGFGLAVAGPLIGWLGWTGVTRRRSVLIWPVMVLGYCLWVVMTMPDVANTAGTDITTGTLAYLTVGLGIWTGGLSLSYWIGIGTVIAATFLLAMMSSRKHSGLLAVVIAVGLAAVAVGYGRGEGSIGTRFVTPSATGLALVWVATAGVAGRVGLPLAVGLVALNISAGWDYGRLCRHQCKAFEVDLRAGELSPVFLAGKHGNGLHVLRPMGLPGITALNRNDWPSYRKVPDDPAFTLVPGTGPFPYLLTAGVEPFLLKGPPPPSVAVPAPGEPVLGLRVHGEQFYPMKYQILRLHWVDENDIPQSAWVIPKVVPGAFVVSFPIIGQPTKLRLEAGCPMLGLRLNSVEWMVPADPARTSASR